MPDRSELESLLTDHLGWVDHVAASLCRRHRLSSDERDEFAGWARMRLVDDDYAVLRKFRGESAITTYLTVVVAMLFRDFRAALRRRWRPSAAALRAGDVAVRLEALVYRDGYRVHQAGEILRSAGHTAVADRELVRLLSTLPPRMGARPVAVSGSILEALAGDECADDGIVAEDAERERSQVLAALLRAMDALDPEDRRIVLLRVWQRMGVAEISRALRLDQRQLFRRLKRIYVQLRRELEAAGITREHVRRMLDDPAALP